MYWKESEAIEADLGESTEEISFKLEEKIVKKSFKF